MMELALSKTVLLYVDSSKAGGDYILNELGRQQHHCGPQTIALFKSLVVTRTKAAKATV